MVEDGGCRAKWTDTSGQIGTLTTVADASACAVRCMGSAGCREFFYNDVSRACRLWQDNGGVNVKQRDNGDFLHYVKLPACIDAPSPPPSPPPSSPTPPRAPPFCPTGIVLDHNDADPASTKTSLGSHDSPYEVYEYVGGQYVITATQRHTWLPFTGGSDAPVGTLYLCTVSAHGSWGVHQAHCCDCTASDPLSASRTSMYGPSGGYTCYYDCTECTEAMSPPPPLSPCLLYTSPSPRDKRQSRMPSSA